ncbi:MAG: site-specific integrase [Acidiferrobacterales bacterium]|nr:site-specific integrase [Acidiferrobacterales bacterium]
MLATIRRIEERGAVDTAHRALQTCGQIFKYAIATARAKYNICADLNGALKPVQKKHYPAITIESELAPLINDIKHYKGSLITRTALQILPYIFIRSGELRHAEWQEIDFDKAIWTIPSHRMKVKTGIDHIVPLSTQVLSLFEELKPLTHPASKYVFHGGRSVKKPMSENAVLAALRGLGYNKDQVTPHGFRATARTLLDEVLGYPPHIIEHQLAHSVKDSNGRAYNRTTHIDQRIEMMQAWADYLDRLAKGVQNI